MEAELVKKFEDALARDPSSRVFAQLGEVYRKMAMVDKAMHVYREGIKRHPSYVLGYLGLAFCYYDLEQFQLVYATLKPLVDSNRDNIRLQRLFASCCEKLNYNQEALATWKYLLFINPKDPESIAKVTALEAEPLAEKNELSAPQIFEIDQLKASPVDDVDDWVRVDLEKPNADIVKESQKELEKVHMISLEDVAEKIEQAEESPLMSLTLVDLYIAQGHVEKAMDVLEKMLELNPSDLRVKEKIAEIDQVQTSVEEEQTEEDAHSRLLQMVEEKQNILVETDEEEVSDSTLLLDTFLRHIKQRAEEKMQRP
ncbi:MAG: hypothetical protein CME71_05625 [Halobacteriovorax sp.]|nr:hypothetical protein [Halobacteriovorax sp.]